MLAVETTLLSMFRAKVNILPDPSSVLFSQDLFK